MKTHFLFRVLPLIMVTACMLQVLPGCGSPADPPCTGDVPVADAGRDREVVVGDTVQLSGEGSFDPDGDTASLTYEWQQTAGPEVPGIMMAERDFAFKPLSPGTYIFGLTVRDMNRCSGSTTVIITAAEVAEVVSQSGGNWSEDIWGLDGAFPNNGVEQSFSVTIDEGQDIALDTDVKLTALSLAPTSQLVVANEVEGDLTIVGQLGAEGALVAGGGRSIHVDGPLAILPGGSYGGPDAQGDPTSAALEAGSITIYEGPIAGSMEVSGNMQVTTADDFVLEGVIRMPLCTPPVFRTRDLARVRVSKDFKINKAATIEYQASERMLLGGSFLNDSIDPTTFDWASGGLSFFAPNGSSTHSFEVAGRDQGASVGFSGNFTMGEVEVGSGCNVIFEDNNDNDEQGQEACTEALYVHRLMIQPGSELTLDNVRVYCDAVEGNRDNVMALGCGELIIATSCVEDAECDDGDACTTGACGTDSRCVFTDMLCAENEVCREGTCEILCTTDSDCDDGNFCNGNETCVGEDCVPGEGPCEPCDYCYAREEECRGDPEVYFEDFESGDGFWAPDQGVWQVGEPSSGPGFAVSGAALAATVLDGNYPHNSSRLISPSIDLPNTCAGNELYVRFQHWFAFGSFSGCSNFGGGGTASCGTWRDSGSVQIRERTDEGEWAEWMTLAAYTGASEVFTNTLLEVTEYAGKQVQLGFLLSYGSRVADGEGWYVDDVRIIGN